MAMLGSEDIGNFLQQLVSAKDDPWFMQQQAPQDGPQQMQQPQQAQYPQFAPQDSQQMQQPMQAPQFAPQAPQQMQQPMQAPQQPQDGGYDQNILQQAYQKAGVGRKRNSLFDILGGIADAFSTEGGGDPNYQNARDKQVERARAYETDMMDRQKFGLTRQTAQNETLMKVGVGLNSLLERVGPEGVRAAIPGFVQAGVFTPEQGQFIMQDPEGAAALFAEGSSGNEFGLNLQTIYNPVTGETRYVQARKSGGAQPVGLPPGFIPAPGIVSQDAGDRIITKNIRTGAIISETPKAGGPEKGELPIYDESNNIVGYRLAPGSKAQREELSAATEERNVRQAQAVSFEGAKNAIGRIKSGLEQMREAGVIVDPDSPSQGMVGRAKATVYNNANWLEAIVNEDGSTGRDMVQAAALELTRSFDAVKGEVANSGATSTSARLMDTIKEAQANLEKVVNARNYKSATISLEAYEENMLALDGLLQQYLAEAEAKRAKLANPGNDTAATPNKPQILNW